MYKHLGSASQSKRQRGELCMRGVWGRGSISKVWFTQRNAGRRMAFQHMQPRIDAGSTHSTREHKHAGQRGQGTRTKRGPASLRAMRAACQLTPDCHNGARPLPAIQWSQHDSTYKRIPIQIQRAKPNPHHARAPHQSRAPEAQCSQAQPPPRLRYQLANNTLTILDDHVSHFV